MQKPAKTSERCDRSAMFAERLRTWSLLTHIYKEGGKMKKRASCLVLGLFLFVAIAQGQEEERKWAGRAVPKAAPKPIKALAAAPTCPIICDPFGALPDPAKRQREAAPY